MSLPAGVHDVTVVRTYLSMAAPTQLVRGHSPAATLRAELVEIADCSLAEWRALYAEIGSAWHWHDRDLWPDAQLAARLAHSAVSVYAARAQYDGHILERAGFLELERHDDGSVEVVYLGLHQRVFGLGLGAWLVSQAVDRAFGLGATRVWLHTCTLDAPAALRNYLARGFTVERSESYIAQLPG